LGVSAVLLIDIHVWAKVISIVVIGLAYEGAADYRDHLQEQLGSEWIDRPRSWKIFWWSFAVIALLVGVFLGGVLEGY